MDVRCDRCQTEYELEDDRVPQSGVSVKCTTCEHVFLVRPSFAVSFAPEPSPPREWKVRRHDGAVRTCTELTTLQKWIVERHIGPKDQVSLSGAQWKPLGEIAELAPFFQVVAAADRAAASPTIAHPAAAQQAPVTLGKPVSKGPALAEISPAAEASLPKGFGNAAFKDDELGDFEDDLRALRRGGGGKIVAALVILVVLGVGGAFVFDGEGFARLLGLAEAETVAIDAPAVPAELSAAHEVPAPAAAADGAAAEAPKAAAEAPKKEAVNAPPPAPAAAARPVPAPTPPVVAAPAPAAATQPAPAPKAAEQEPRAVEAEPKPAAREATSFEQVLATANRLRRSDKAAQALDWFGKAEELKPDSIEPLVGKGLCLLDLGNHAAAIQAFRQAVAHNDRYADAWMGLGEAHRALGEREEALAAYQKYLDIGGLEANVARAQIAKLRE